MSHITNAPRAHQDKSDHPQNFICLKNGRWRPVDVPPGTFAVMYRGQYRVVFSRAETDEEYFRNYAEMPFRLKLHRSRRYAPGYFMFKVVTRIGIYAVGDRWDFRDYDANRYGSPREYWISECERMLANPNRCMNSDSWLASQGPRQ